MKATAVEDSLQTTHRFLQVRTEYILVEYQGRHNPDVFQRQETPTQYK